jgi:hypothetical protein
MGNNGIWALEKHPMELLYGYSVVADLRPGTRYDQMVTALGGHGALVERPEELRPALVRAFEAGRPALVNVLTDPSVAYPRRSSIARPALEVASPADIRRSAAGRSHEPRPRRSRVPGTGCGNGLRPVGAGTQPGRQSESRVGQPAQDLPPRGVDDPAAVGQLEAGASSTLRPPAPLPLRAMSGSLASVRVGARR